MKIIVLGYGNELRGDDGIGPWVARRLAEGEMRGRADTRQAQMLLPEHSADFAECDGVILVDATVNVGAGKWQCQRIRPDAPSADGSPLPSIGHFSSPESLLSSVKTLFGKEPETWLYTIGVADMAMGFHLSDAALEAGEEVARAIEARLAAWASGL